MKKILKGIFILFVSLFIFTLTSCKSYEEEAGVYHLVEGQYDSSILDYKYYTIELKEDGEFFIEYETKTGNKTEVEGTFEIKDSKLYICVIEDSLAIEVFDYKNNMIILDKTIDGRHIYYGFRRNLK